MLTPVPNLLEAKPAAERFLRTVDSTPVPVPVRLLSQVFSIALNHSSDELRVDAGILLSKIDPRAGALYGVLGAASDDPRVRTLAAKSVAEGPKNLAVTHLLSLLLDENDEGVCLECVRLLRGIDRAAAIVGAGQLYSRDELAPALKSQANAVANFNRPNSIEPAAEALREISAEFVGIMKGVWHREPRVYQQASLDMRFEQRLSALEPELGPLFYAAFLARERAAVEHN